MKLETSWTPIERAFLASDIKSYENEMIPSIVVSNVYELGKLVALSFIGN